VRTPAQNATLSQQFRRRVLLAPLGEAVVRGSTESCCLGTAKALGEFVFHPSSPDAAEDDGVLTGDVYDRATDRSELAILDAQTLQAIACIKLPHRVSAGFHGNWVPSVN
jgi:carotenoid cleavage oxygenase